MAEYCMGYPKIKITSNGKQIILNDVIEYDNDDETMKITTFRYHGDDLQDVSCEGMVAVCFDLYDGTSVDAHKVGESEQTWGFNSISAWIATASKINDINPFCIKLTIG